MKADIVSIGTELLMGELVDTNSAYLAARLPPIGIELQRTTHARDDLEALAEDLRQAWQRSDLVLTTGGLGPTDDDLTREAIALLMGETLYVDGESLDRLRETFRRRGAPMLEVNVKQANLIPSARSIPNENGTAPGWWVESGGRIIVAMPGPPGEMHPMWETQVQPQLRDRSDGSVILTRSLKTHGLGESAINELIAPLFHLPEVSLGMYAQAQGVQVRLRARAGSAEAAESMLSPVETELRRLLGDYVWGADEDVLEEQVGRELSRRGLSLAVMESCTGGLLAHTITQVSGSSGYFLGGIVSYTNEVKAAWGVDASLISEHGVVSPEVASDMARACRQAMSADMGIGITGVAGPDELEGQPVGTVHIGFSHPWGDHHVSRRFPGQRALIKQRAVVQALLELWELLRSNPNFHA